MRPRLDTVVLGLPMQILDTSNCCSAQEPSTSDEINVSGIWINTRAYDYVGIDFSLGWLARLQHLQC